MKSKELIFSWWLLLVSAGFGAGYVSGSKPAGAVAPTAAGEAGRVLRVVDGDTYDVLTGGQVLRVRLLGVDAPELGQPFGAQVADSVTRLLLRQPVRLARRGTDLYGRTLGTLTLPAAGGQRALDSLLVVRGWAWAWDPNHRVVGRATEQAAAEQAGRGLWKCGDAIPPKLWRSFDARNKRRYRGSCTW